MIFIRFLAFPWNIDLSKFTYLDFPNLNWKWEIPRVFSLLKTLSILTLPWCLRAVAMNTYIFSRLHLQDLHSPMTKEDFKTLGKEIKQYMPHILPNSLYAPGFGHIDISLQVLGRRAKIIHHPEILLVNSYETRTISLPRDMLISKPDLQSSSHCTWITPSSNRSPTLRSRTWLKSLCVLKMRSVASRIIPLNYSRDSVTSTLKHIPKLVVVRRWVCWLAPNSIGHTSGRTSRNLPTAEMYG